MIKTKATAIACSNTALIKYWGKKDESLIIPMNNSISVTTSALTTKTTVEFSEEYSQDEFFLNDKEQNGKPKERVITHLNLIRELTDANLNAKVYSENNFPTAAGLASSASGFAALTIASCKALNLKKTSKELSMISRRGSGSSCRSIYGGYVEWISNDKNDDSYAIQLKDENWFDIRDIIVVLPSHERKMSTREAMKLSMKTSPFFKSRLITTEDNLKKVKQAILEKDFDELGFIAEMDCLSMHSVALTSNPPQLFWVPETIKVMHLVEEMREQGIKCYYTIDTGANMHILTLPKYEKEVINNLEEKILPQKIISSKPGPGVKLVNDHHF